ncbi:MAG: hypothetical protein V2B20_17155 [Pseudomonadota bacterium]
MSNNTSNQPQSSSGPTIIQAFIWGIMAAAFGTLFAFIGSLLSETPALPPATDSLHGASTPAEMNRIVDTLLSAGQSAIGHDSALASKLGIAIIALCALIIGTAVWVVVRRHRFQSPPTPRWRTVLLLLLLVVPVIAISVGACFMKGRLLRSSSISQALCNENTRPPAVRKGSMVEVAIPITLQSFFGYHDSHSLKVGRVVATLPSGEQVPLTLTDARLRDGGRKPGKTDFIPVMENVKLRLQFTVPDDPRLCGALIDLAVSGSLGLIPSGSKQPVGRGNFDTTARFRVARDQEADFQTSYDAVSSKITGFNWFSFPSAGFAFIAITFFSPWLCRKCQGRVSAFKIRDGHLCPKCSEEQQKVAEAEQKAAEEEKKAAEEEEKAARQADRASGASEPKTTCSVCNVAVLASTAARTGGKCMPCFKKR